MTHFADTLGFYVQRSAYTAGQLAHLSGVPKMTIVHWLEGRVSRPRSWQPLIQLLAALRLNETEANEVLRAAGQGVIRQLRGQVVGTADEKFLEYWSLGETRPQRTPFQVIADAPLFVGREGLLVELEVALRAPHHAAPYVLYGMAGVGKTTLAVHLAYRVREQFPDGVLWARPGLADPLTILATFARAYGQEVSDYADMDSRGRVVRDILAPKRTLILLDDVTTWAEIQPLLPPTGSCAVLLTTQQRELAARPGVRAWAVEPFAAADSLALFARVGDPGWVAHHQVALQEVAERLGHWPLAVGLVASRLAFEPVWVAEQFLAQLRQSAWPAALDDIQQTIHQTLALLVSRLSPQAKTLLPVLGLMGVHEFAEDAAAHLSDGPEPLLAVHELVSRSFLQATRPRRVRWHPLVQTTIQTHFPPDETQIGRFVAYSLELARSGQAGELDREQGHLTPTRQLVWQKGAWHTWARFIVALWPYWEQRGLYRLIAAEVQERLDWLRDHLAADDPVWQDSVWSQVWVIRARLARFEHQYDAAAAALDVARSWAQEDPALLTEIWLERGVVANYQGDNETAATCLAEGMALARPHQLARLMARLLKELGILALEKGNWAEMAQAYQQALVWANREHHPVDEINLIRGLGTLHFFKGDVDTAFRFYAQSLAMARELDVRDALVHGLNNLAVIFVLQGQLVQADKQLTEGEQLAEAIGHRQTMALLGYNRALLTWYQGDAAASRTHFLEAKRLAETTASTRLLQRIENSLESMDAAALPSERLILFYD